MEYITASSDIHGSGLVTIPLKDIIYLEYIRQDKGIFIHSIESQGFLPGQFGFWTNALINSGLDQLMVVDRNFALDPQKIAYINAKHRLVYFAEPKRINKYCSVSSSNFDSLMQALNTLGRPFIIV